MEWFKNSPESMEKERRKIFISGDVFDPDVERQLAEEGFAVEKETQVRNLKERLQDKDVYVLAGDEFVKKSDLEEAEKLKTIIFFGAQAETFFEKEALELAKEKGTEVIPTPGFNTEAVAEFTAGLIAESARNLSYLLENIKEGKWAHHKGFELKGKTLGILGAGKIGTRVAQIMARGYEMNVLYFSRSQHPEIENVAQFVPPEKLMKESDIISLHVPYSEETKNYLDERLLSLAKPGLILINTARAGLVEPKALKESLASGKISLATFDGYYTEPFDIKKDSYGFSKFIKEGRFRIAPHQAFNTIEANKRTSEEAKKIILERYKKGK